VELLEKESLLNTEGTDAFGDHLNSICSEQLARLNELRLGVLENSLCEVSKTPFGTDADFLQRVQAYAAESSVVEAAPAAFVVHHFAESVTYSPEKMVDKNKFRLYDNLAKAIAGCGDVFVQRLVQADLGGESQQLSERFLNSLDSLLELLSVSMPRFIRCLKSNAQKQEWIFEPNLLHRQLRYASILQTVRICGAGYPETLDFMQFYARCRPLFKESEDISAYEAGFSQYFNDGVPVGEVPQEIMRDGCSLMLEQCVERFGKDIGKAINIGTTSVMLREEASQALDNEKVKADQGKPRDTRAMALPKRNGEKRGKKIKDMFCSLM